MDDQELTMKTKETLKTNTDVQNDQQVVTELNPTMKLADIETGTQVQTLEKQDVVQRVDDDIDEKQMMVESSQTSSEQTDPKMKKNRKSRQKNSDSSNPDLQSEPVILSDVDLTTEKESQHSTSLNELEVKLDEISQNVEQTGELIAESTDTTRELIESTEQIATEIQPEPTPNYSPLLVVHHDRGGKIAEEYRALRTNLLSKYPDDRFCLMVTSAQAAEGKTVTCLNLGLAMAERLDRRTIVVDYNLRNGKMAQLLGAKTGLGVADVLLGQATLDEVIQSTIYPNLFFIQAGRIAPNQAGELLSRSITKDIVQQLKQNYEYVLIDTPAANTYSDAGITGLATNDALLVVRMNKTPREQIERAILSLQAANVNIAGILLTHRQPRWFN